MLGIGWLSMDGALYFPNLANSSPEGLGSWNTAAFFPLATNPLRPVGKGYGVRRLGVGPIENGQRLAPIRLLPLTTSSLHKAPQVHQPL